MGKIIVFYGADHKSGCTMICQCFSEMLLQKMPELRLILIHAEGKGGCDYSPGTRVDMDGLFPYLEKESLDFSELAEKSLWRRNFGIIGGSSLPGAFEDFHPGMMDFLLDGLSGHFDLIVASCGADIQNGLSLGAMMNAEERFLVMAPKESAVRRYEAARGLFSQLDVDFDKLILNRFGSRSIFTPAYLSGRLGLGKDSFLVVRDSKFGDVCEMDEKSLLNYRDSYFRRDISFLCAKISKCCGLEELSHG